MGFYKKVKGTKPQRGSGGSKPSNENSPGGSCSNVRPQTETPQGKATSQSTIMPRARALVRLLETIHPTGYVVSDSCPNCVDCVEAARAIKSGASKYKHLLAQVERFDALLARFDAAQAAHGPAVLAAVGSAAAPPDPEAFAAFFGTAREVGPKMRRLVEEEPAGILRAGSAAIAPSMTLTMFGRGCSTTVSRAQAERMALTMELRSAVERVEGVAWEFEGSIEEIIEEVLDTQEARRERAAAKGVTVAQLMRSERHLF